MEFTIKLCTSPCSSVNCIWHFATLKPFPRIMWCLIQQKICNIKGHCTVLFTGYTCTTNFVFKCKSLALETNFYTVKHGPKLILTVWVRKWFWNIYDQVINFQIQRVQWLVYKSYIWMHLWDFNFFYLHVYIAVPLVMVAQFHTDLQVQIQNIIYKASEKINLSHKKNQITHRFCSN